MTRFEFELPDEIVAEAQDATEADLVGTIVLAERILAISRRHSEGRLRTVFAYYLLVTGSLILVVSLGLICYSAINHSNLGEGALSALIGSVATEFIGMLYFVVRYLFSRE